MTALHFLTSTKPATKARYIASIYWDNPSIIKYRYDFPKNEKLNGYDKSHNIDTFRFRKDHEIKRMFTIFANVALTLLPAYASDYPDNNRKNNKKTYYKVVMDWNRYKLQVIDVMAETFCSAIENG